MNIIKSKIGRIINFIKNENKFNRGDLVKVVKNTSKYKMYDKYIGQYAVVTNIHYDKKENIVGLKFLNGENLDFRLDELKKCDYIEETTSKECRQLLKMI